MTIPKKIYAGYLLAILFTMIVAGTALYVLNGTVQSYQGFIDINQRLVLNAAELRTAVLRQVGGYRGFLAFADDAYLNEWTQGINAFRTKVNEMRALAPGAEDQNTLADIATTEDRWSELQKEIIDLRKQGKTREAVKEKEALVRSVREEMFTNVDSFVNRQNGILLQARQEVSARVSRANATLWIISLLSIVFGFGIGFLITRAVSVPLNESVALLSSSSSEISALTSQIASSVTETASSVNETLTTVEEVKQTAQLSVQKAKYVSDTAHKTVQISESGKAASAKAVQGMTRVKEQTESVAEVIVKLSEQSQAIGEVVASVADLAEQSNLLAVNAAIEAAKAGESGKGFTVVAHEVRSLAEQSKQATIQVRSMLSEVQKSINQAVMAIEQGTRAVESGVEVSRHTGESIQMLAEGIEESSQAATQIAASSQQQLAGMSQIVIAMENIKQAAAQNVAGTKQAEQAARSLDELGRRLKSLVQSA